MNKEILNSKKRFIFVLLFLLVFGSGAESISAETNSNALYVPLIGITSVPDPLALPQGPGDVTYHYAVKNFLREAALIHVQVIDDTCSPVTFVEGDDNHDSKLDYSETWRYICTIRLSTTTQSTATARGTANSLTATHQAYATVVVGAATTPPLVSIVNITKVAYPLSLSSEGGSITFTYRVNNPGVAPLSDVNVTDNKCVAMSGKLGDTNGNNLLDTNEVWVYTCTTILTQTTTNTVTVTAYANGLKAVSNDTITVKVDIPTAQSVPGFPNVGDGGVNPNIKIVVWAALSVVLAALVIFFVAMRTSIFGKTHKKNKSS